MKTNGQNQNIRFVRRIDGQGNFHRCAILDEQGHSDNADPEMTRNDEMDHGFFHTITVAITNALTLNRKAKQTPDDIQRWRNETARSSELINLTTAAQNDVQSVKPSRRDDTKFTKNATVEIQT